MMISKSTKKSGNPRKHRKSRKNSGKPEKNMKIQGKIRKIRKKIGDGGDLCQYLFDAFKEFLGGGAPALVRRPRSIPEPLRALGTVFF